MIPENIKLTGSLNHFMPSTSEASLDLPICQGMDNQDDIVYSIKCQSGMNGCHLWLKMNAVSVKMVRNKELNPSRRSLKTDSDEVRFVYLENTFSLCSHRTPFSRVALGSMTKPSSPLVP